MAVSKALTESTSEFGEALRRYFPFLTLFGALCLHACDPVAPLYGKCGVAKPRSMRNNSVITPVRDGYDLFRNGIVLILIFVFPGLSLRINQMIQMKTIPSRNQDSHSTLVCY
jgi:hypothetical protein